MSEKYVAPAWQQKFTCGHCGALSAHALWGSLHGQSPVSGAAGRNSCQFRKYKVAECLFCEKPTIFDGDVLVYPTAGNAPFAAAGMAEVPRVLYEEARDIVGRSPRAAAALLRLAADEYTKILGAEGKDFFKRIHSLVEKGLNVNVERAFTVSRKRGNEAVHEGEIQLDDTAKIAQQLFLCVNWIADWHHQCKQLEEWNNEVKDD